MTLFSRLLGGDVGARGRRFTTEDAEYREKRLGLHYAMRGDCEAGCVMVTLLEESSGTQAVAVDSDPLEWPLSDQEQAVWDELREFRAEHPVRLLRTALWTTPCSEPPIVAWSSLGASTNEHLDV